MKHTLKTLLTTTLLSIPAVFAGGVIESKEAVLPKLTMW